MGSRTDADLLVAFRTDTEAFEELYVRHVGRVVRFAARRVRAPEEVVDLVAAVWLEVVASLDRFDPSRGDGLPWILGIAANLVAAERRRQARERDAVRRLAGRRVLMADDFARLEQEIDAQAIAPRLRRAIETLPAAERPVAELMLLEELQPAQAARALGIRPVTARMRLARARRKLRAAAEGHDLPLVPEVAKEALP